MTISALVFADWSAYHEANFLAKAAYDRKFCACDSVVRYLHGYRICDGCGLKERA